MRQPEGWNLYARVVVGCETREPTPAEEKVIEAFLRRARCKDEREPLGALEVRGVGWVCFYRCAPTPADCQ